VSYSEVNNPKGDLKVALERRYESRSRPVGFYPLPERRVTSGEFVSRYQPVSELGARTGLLYIHVPFCTQRCSFCRFYSGPHVEERAEAYVSSALTQVELWAELRRSDPSTGSIDAVFLGGGSPSSLSVDQLDRLLDGVRARLPFSADCEITMEWYPADQSLDRFEAVLDRGVDRISFGVQSFDDEVLRAIGSRHSAADSLLMSERAAAAGLASFNIDLMANVPGQRLDSHIDDINIAISTGAPNIALNPLELTAGTPLAARAAAIGFDEIDMEKRRWLEVTRHHLQERGFEHQRARNFARPGFRHRYNAATVGVSYDILPIGPGAYGFVGGWAVHIEPDLARWRRLVSEGSIGVTAVCVPSTDELKRSFLITSLLELGFDREGYESIFGADALADFPSLATLESLGALRTVGGVTRLTDAAILYADEISYEFYSVGQSESFASHLISKRRDGTTQYFPISRA
jgi:coproporphyrinogen III oxidase-like Fe-S oxidoreductase